MRKKSFLPLNYWVGSFFLSQLQNRAFRLPELLKPDTKPPCTACQAIEGGQNVPVTTCNPSWDSFSFPSEAGGWWVVRTCRCSRRIWWVSRGFRRPLLPQSAPGLWNRTPNESIRHGFPGTCFLEIHCLLGIGDESYQFFLGALYLHLH